jgi:hypothetical protein
MRRGPKPAKSKEAKPPVASKSPKNEDSRVRDLEKRLAEALRGKAEATANWQRLGTSSPWHMLKSVSRWSSRPPQAKSFE